MSLNSEAQIISFHCRYLKTIVVPKSQLVLWKIILDEAVWSSGES